MTTTVTMYGQTKYTSGPGGDEELVPFAQIIEGLRMSKLSVDVPAAGNQDVVFSNVGETEIVYFHLYVASTMKLVLYTDADVIVFNSLVKGHVILTLAPGCGFKPKARFENPSTTKNVEGWLRYGSVPANGDVPGFYQD